MTTEQFIENAKLKCMQKNNIDILLEKDIISYIKEFEKNNGKCCSFKRKKVV